MEYKLGQDARLFVRLVDNVGAPVTGVTDGDVTATVEKANGSTAAITVTGSNWEEVTTGAFSGQGKYSLTVPASEVDVAGVYCYAVDAAPAGAVTYLGVVEVVAAKEVDTKAVVDAIRADYTTGRATNLDYLDAAVSGVANDVLDAPLASHTTAGTMAKAVADADVNALLGRKVALGKWAIVGTQMTLYAEDGITALQVFDLKDSLGSPTSTKVASRNPTLPVV